MADSDPLQADIRSLATQICSKCQDVERHKAQSRKLGGKVMEVALPVDSIAPERLEQPEIRAILGDLHKYLEDCRSLIGSMVKRNLSQRLMRGPSDLQMFETLYEHLESCNDRLDVALSTGFGAVDGDDHYEDLRADMNKGAMTMWLDEQNGWSAVYVTTPSKETTWRRACLPVLPPVAHDFQPEMPLSREESSDFLKKVAEKHRLSFVSEQSFSVIGGLLSDLPTALHVVAQVMNLRKDKGKIEVLLQDLAERQQQPEFKATEVPGESSICTAQLNSIQSIWSLLLQDLRARKEVEAVRCLHLLAFFAAEELPLSWLEVWKKKEDVRTLIVRLHRLELVAFDETEGVVVMDPALQAVMRRSLADSERRAWVSAALIVVRRMWPFRSESSATWRLACATAIHADAVAQHVQVSGLATPDARAHLESMAHFSVATQSFERAISLWSTLAALELAATNASHPNYAATLNNLAHVQRELGDHASAQDNYQKSLSILERSRGRAHPDIAAVLMGLGASLYRQRKFTRARPLFERALKIERESLPQAHPRIVNTLTWLKNWPESIISPTSSQHGSPKRDKRK